MVPTDLVPTDLVLTKKQITTIFYTHKSLEEKKCNHLEKLKTILSKLLRNLMKLVESAAERVLPGLPGEEADAE